MKVEIATTINHRVTLDLSEREATLLRTNVHEMLVLKPSTTESRKLLEEIEAALDNR